MRDAEDADVFKNIIKPAVEDAHHLRGRGAKAGLRCEDAETSPQADQFSCDICYKIHSAFLIVVDLSKHRPNVFYELGIAHALGKPTKLICRDAGGSGASDIIHLRYVPFDLSPAGINKLRGEIQTWVEEQLEKRRRSQASVLVPPSVPRSVLGYVPPPTSPLPSYPPTYPLPIPPPPDPKTWLRND